MSQELKKKEILKLPISYENLVKLVKKSPM